MKIVAISIVLIIIQLSVFGQPEFQIGELFIGEISDNVNKEPVYLGDSLVFYLQTGQRFVCRYSITSGNEFRVSLADGKNGIVRSNHIKRSMDQSPFKFTYPQNYFPFTTDHTIFGKSNYSNCNYAIIFHWLKYFNDTTDFVGLTLRAYNKDTVALFSILREPFLDTDGSGQWSFNNWKIINSYTDKELSQIILNRNRQGRRYVLDALYSSVVLSPFGEENSFLDLYYSKFYPFTWMLIEFERYYIYDNTVNKKYNKEFKKLKKLILNSFK